MDLQDLAIILIHKNLLLWTADIQSKLKNNLEKNFSIFQIPNSNPREVLKKFNKKLNLGFDPKLFTNLSLLRYFGNDSNLIPIHTNLIDQINPIKKKETQR